MERRNNELEVLDDVLLIESRDNEVEVLGSSLFSERREINDMEIIEIIGGLWTSKFITKKDL